MEDCDSVTIRKRGRPVGKCRKPLNREQRKARNAQYERERRVEIAEATTQLMEAIGYESSSSVSVANLLHTALEQIKNKSTPSQSIESLRKKNDDLSKEIQDLEHLLSKQQKKEKKGSSSSSKINKRGVKRKTENEPPSNMIEPEGKREKTEYEFDMDHDDPWSCLG